jgi:metallo-beta-lactamase family protein
VIVDSPMASKALDVYRREVNARSAELRPELFGYELFSSLDITETRTTEESKALNGRRGPMIIISASGMATGGRVVHHLAQRIGDGRNKIVLVGFQAPGTRGDALRNGVNSIKMLGRYHAVHADVVSIDLSTHADRSELLDWLGTADHPDVVYVNHGEEEAAADLAGAIGKRLSLHAVAPVGGERVLVPRAQRRSR